MCCDVKPASVSFLTQNSGESVFESVEAVESAGEARCAKHGGKCLVPGAVDLVVAGCPCSPYSMQRPKRHASGRCVTGGR